MSYRYNFLFFYFFFNFADIYIVVCCSGAFMVTSSSWWVWRNLTLVHSERPKLYAILAFLSAVGLNKSKTVQPVFQNKQKNKTDKSALIITAQTVLGEEDKFGFRCD